MTPAGPFKSLKTFPISSPFFPPPHTHNSHTHCSAKITDLSEHIERSETLCNPASALWSSVLREALPSELVSTVGFDTILQRLPSAYKRALFASHLASRFIYRYGLETNEFAFYEYVTGLLTDRKAL